MSILSRFKSKKQTGKKEENVLEMVKEQPPASEAKSVPLKENTGMAHRILKHYHLSERSNQLSQQGRYVFVVDKRANKLEIKKAVEKVYEVHVQAVNVLNSKGKPRRSGRTFGTTSDWKKAYVTLRAGEKISGLAEGV